MTSVVTFRTSPINKIELIKRAEALGIPVSELMDHLVADFLQGNPPEFTDEDEGPIINRHVMLRRKIWKDDKIKLSDLMSCKLVRLSHDKIGVLLQ